MSDLHAAAVVLARSLTLGGTVFTIGAEEFAASHLADDRFVALDRGAAEELLREGSRNGDAVLVLGDVPDRDRILRRAPAWGLAAVWVGETARPDQGLASVALLVPDTESTVAALMTGARGLVGNTVALAPAIVDCTDEVCITCSDEGRLGEVIAVQGEYFPALVRTADGEEEVDVTVVGDVAPRDLILIHAGSAIALVPDGTDVRGNR